jgi:motility quorum-sensing regulator/GCU-specific mRNA interferase toxin
MTPNSPTYPVQTVKDLVRVGEYRVTGTALSGAGELGLDESDILDCIERLTLDELHKTMASTDKPGLSQDVYRTIAGGFEVYLKVQIITLVTPRQIAVVISFKRWGS